MRTNIDIDDDTLEAAMQAGPFKTKKDAVEAGLKLLARQAAYREILKWQGKLKWEGDDSVDWTVPAVSQEPAPSAAVVPAATTEKRKSVSVKPVAKTVTSARPVDKRRAGR
ncbi:MAG: type II toxin-antitoxin system VapB family antitoxin [Pseudorhodobacter sp.]|nr:type II toxin-antitoxin system VapB family antitoxin [Rhizobacter sp.]